MYHPYCGLMYPFPLLGCCCCCWWYCWPCCNPPPVGIIIDPPDSPDGTHCDGWNLVVGFPLPLFPDDRLIADLIGFLLQDDAG